ncbi:hypothetical protein Moror_16743 [Moniliophthora roreri MCA 2997]|uniref:Uncharacterized protein n=1 Tax=Moniliophthora roreri (strain MCA 2997) TaxID=1381753 RepID=V2XQM4_MONRO|nr:hypothetical protein Moror_16743 [Moniliophthora roreri MCA 2997]
MTKPKSQPTDRSSSSISINDDDSDSSSDSVAASTHRPNKSTGRQLTQRTGRAINVNLKDKFAQNTTDQAAATESINEIREELLGVTDALRKKQDKIDELQTDLGTVKATITENQVTLKKHKEKTKARLDKYEARFSEAEQVIQQLREELEVAKKEAVRPYNINWLNACFSMGWQRQLKEGFDKVCASSFKGTTKKHLYFPGRTFFVNDQHALAVGPKTQSSSKHNFDLESPFDELYGEERELFFDQAVTGSADIFYAGTYEIIRPNVFEAYPHGVEYDNSFFHDFGMALHRVGYSVVDSQIQKPMLRKDEIKDLAVSGDIKLEFIGLKCVGFNHDVYRSATSATPIAEPEHSQTGFKRPREYTRESASGGFIRQDGSGSSRFKRKRHD